MFTLALFTEAVAVELPPPLRDLEEAATRPIEVPAQIQPPTVVLYNGTIMTATGQIHDPGYVVLRGGRIEAVGTGDPPNVADADATITDVKGHWVTPGLIDTHSHMGVYPAPRARAHSDGNEATAPVTAGVWAEHAVWPQDPALEWAAAGGVTTIQVLPGSANLIGGRGVVLHNLPQRGSRAMRFPGAPETVKLACGENPKRVYGERNMAPSTRMGNLRGDRQAFADAQQYLREWTDYAAKAPPEGAKKSKKKGGKGAALPPKRNLEMDTLALILTGNALPQIHCYRADDMLSMMQVADEFGFEIRSFHHALEAYKIRDLLATHQIASSTWADWWGFKLEAYDGIPHNLAMITEAGAIGIVHSDSAVGVQRLNQEAGKAYYTGIHADIELTEDQALQWVTANPAWALGIEDEVGTLQEGLRADVVVWDGHPLRIQSKARWVYVDGHLRYDDDQGIQDWSDFMVGQEVAP